METRLQKEIEGHPYPLLFAALSGAHLYGFPSPDSDYDLRGIHLLPLKDVVGLKPLSETVQRCYMRDGLEMDLVTHDVRKYFQLILKRSGEILEQLFSPLVLYTCDTHEELRQLTRSAISRQNASHYLGFAKAQWSELEKAEQPQIKGLLYLYRVLMTGIHLMREGEVEANIVKLNDSFRLRYLPELIDAKMEGSEKAAAENVDMSFHAAEYHRLVALLKQERERSLLPEDTDIREELDALLVSIRLGTRK